MLENVIEKIKKKVQVKCLPSEKLMGDLRTRWEKQSEEEFHDSWKKNKDEIIWVSVGIRMKNKL